MTIAEKFYNLVLYNRTVKRAASAVLRSNIVSNNQIYLYFYRKLLAKKMAKYSQKPFRVMIENTSICNANCVFCPHETMKRKIGTMSMKLFKRIIDNCKHLNIDYVTIYGFGEPLLDTLFFDRLVYARNCGLKRITTNTNAMYLSNEKVDRLLDIGIDEIYISFDAASNKTYKKVRPGLDFDTVEKNIKYLCDSKKVRRLTKPEITLCYVEFDTNRHETDLYIKKWHDLVDHISVSYIHNWTGSITDSGVVRLGKKDPCRLLWTDMVISWNGDVPLCCNDYENLIILGNLSSDNIEDIWGGSKMETIRNYHRSGGFDKISICKNCSYNYHYKSPWWVAK